MPCRAQVADKAIADEAHTDDTVVRTVSFPVRKLPVGFRTQWMHPTGLNVARWWLGDRQLLAPRWLKAAFEPMSQPFGCDTNDVREPDLGPAASLPLLKEKLCAL
jgi:hypothetical protein